MSTPITPELTAQLAALTPQQLAFLAGYAWAKSQGAAAAADLPLAAVPAAVATASAPARRVTVLSASQTGNARRVAEQLLVKLEGAGVDAKLVAAADYKSKNLPNEDIVLLVSSTQGEGEPPEEAVPLFKLLSGKKAPDLSGLSFAVLGLGDSSYERFCQAGKDLDTYFAKQGAKRLADVGICDLDFQAAADAWVASTSKLVAD